MRRVYGWLSLLIVTVLLPCQAEAQSAIRWEPTVENAKMRAAQSDRLVLIHFWADWCGACRRMEREVLQQPEVAAALQTYFVPVRINADYFPATRKQYGVTALPTDVIITSRGELVDRLRGPQDAAQYTAQLNRIAASVRASEATGQYTQNTGGVPIGNAVAAQPPTGGPNRSAGAGASDDRYADYFQRRQQPAVAASAPQVAQASLPFASSPPSATPPMSPPAGAAQPPTTGPDPQYAEVSPSAPQAAAMNPPLGLDGYCPVELNENTAWVEGNRLWGVRHENRTYLFAGPEQQRRFLAQPDRYAPVLSGNDVVVAIEQGQSIAGRRQHGVFFGGKVYLFADETSLRKFTANPAHYATQALQAMRPQAGPGSPIR
ncbi:MAG: thioredoxin family protein [Pirellulales bacterium]|nr:thioredoxin family protein [Pirellulales bacterium]